MKLKTRAITALILTVVLIALAVLVWANQTKRITIWGADTVTVEKKSLMAQAVLECPGHQVVTGVSGMPTGGLITPALGGTTAANLSIYKIECGYVKVNGLETIRTIYGTVDFVSTRVDGSNSYIKALCPPGTFVSGFTRGQQTTKPVTTYPLGIYSGQSTTIQYPVVTPPKITCVKLTATNSAVVSGQGDNALKLVSTGTLGGTALPNLPAANCGNSVAFGLETKSGLSLTAGFGQESFIHCYSLLTASGGTTTTITSSPPPLQDTTPPSAPPNLTAEALSETEIQLTWTASSDNIGVAGYKLYNADTNELIKNTTALSYKATGAKCATIYRYFVVSYDNAGNHSNRSIVAEATTLACSPENDKEAPSVPGNLRYSDPTASGNAPDCWYAELTWEASTDNVGVTGYDVYNAENNELITTTNETRYNLTGLKENTKYSYYIKAHDAAGNSSEASSTKSFTTNTCPAQTQPSVSDVSILVRTGAVLWFNIGIALLLAGIITYFLMKKRPNY